MEEENNELIEAIDFNFKELNYIIEHSVILGTNRIADSIDSIGDGLISELERIGDILERIEDKL